MAIFQSKRKRGPKSDWFNQFAQCIDEDGIVWVNDVADYMEKPLGTVKQKVEALAKEFGEQRFYDMITAASHAEYSGRTCRGFDEQTKERKRKNRNKKDENLAQLQFLADQIAKKRAAEEAEEVDAELAVA
jgi:hypothetical protein